MTLTMPIDINAGQFLAYMVLTAAMGGCFGFWLCAKIWR